MVPLITRTPSMPGMPCDTGIYGVILFNWLLVNRNTSLMATSCHHESHPAC
jgi:hypothetical protein